uniref:Uncharacterized protein n=1 Tax=Bradyrhizobium amphicarpaeae TaxID=1404768 RepID=A0A2U8Q1K2_9BRAD|nr:hypothetical protein CIT40_30715 [Bradyrhizobium amphicarpaeae]
MKLDRDDFDMKGLASEPDDADEASHAEIAEVQENERGCPLVGMGARPWAGVPILARARVATHTRAPVTPP